MLRHTLLSASTPAWKPASVVVSLGASVAASVAACITFIAVDVQAAPNCHAAAPRQLVETFLSADCETCWRAADSPALPPRSLRLDWIVPSDKGDDAPLAAAALREAAGRAATAPSADAAVQQAHKLASPTGFSLQVSTGVAWNGYLGLSFDLQGRAHRKLPPDAQGWLALVERLPVGQNGSPVERQLVRTVIGPMPLILSARNKTQELRAVLIPPNSVPELLAAVGWVERADGSVLMMAESAAVDAGCPK